METLDEYCRKLEENDEKSKKLRPDGLYQPIVRPYSINIKSININTEDDVDSIKNAIIAALDEVKPYKRPEPKVTVEEITFKQQTKQENTKLLTKLRNFWRKRR